LLWRVEQLVAVHVVARRAAAQSGALRAPPTGGNGARRTRVVAGDRAAKRCVAVAACGPATAGLPATGARRGVRADRTEDVARGVGRQCRADDRRAHEHAPPTRARRQQCRRLVHQPATHALIRLPRVSGRTVTTVTQRYTHTATRKTNGMPAAG